MVGRSCWRVLTHTLQKDTTPSSWRQRERAQEGNKGKQKGGRQETKRRARQELDTAETHASGFSGSTDGLVNKGRTSTGAYIQHTDLIFTQTQKCQTRNRSPENDDIDDVTERRWRLKGVRTTWGILPLVWGGGGITAGRCWGQFTFTCVIWPGQLHNQNVFYWSEGRRLKAVIGTFHMSSINTAGVFFKGHRILWSSEHADL